jgi:type IV pilus assembly protein PilB
MSVIERSLGSTLLKMGLITAGQLEEALREQGDTHERLGEILCRLGYLAPDDMAAALSSQLGYARFEPSRHEVQPAALELVPYELARRHGILPVSLRDGVLTAATHDPLNIEAIDHLERLAGRRGCRVELLVATAEVLDGARETSYGQIERNRSVTQLIDRVVDEVGEGLVAEDELDEQEAQRRAEDAGTISLVDQIIGQALQERATDIHVEPQVRGLLIRYRVDGMLYEALTPPRAVYTGMVSRLKILSDMDIAERRAAQDGRFTFRAGGREVDIRVSAIPTIHGEKLVLRLLDKSSFNFSLRDLGFSQDDYDVFRAAIHHPYGMVLLSGPTGSGKTTTLYAGLQELRNPTINITTIEDPVEYQMAGINQVQVNERKRVTFAQALRSFLRQDPDVIMVGEIRDRDTAEIAIRAALTGHRVFSTIHANDAPTTATRLVSMGVEPFMAASALTLVAAQRLVRRNCPHCLKEYAPDPEVFLGIGDAVPDTAAGPRFRRGGGCAACKGRGYLGRVAIVEKMPLTPALRQLIAENRPAGEIRRQAQQEGMRTLRQSGLAKACEGLTTVEEVLRVCLSDE